jgi:transcriptional regulator with XRE-family HTH domain
MTEIALIEAVEQAGKKRGLSRTQLAAKLGVTENYFYRIKAGDRKPGAKVLSAIMREFPQLQPLVLEYLAGGNGSKEARDGNTN